MAAVKSGLETLRDYAIVEFLANRGSGKKEISVTDDALFKRLTKLFEEAGLSCEPLDYMKSAPNFWDRQNQLNNDAKGHLKSKVRTSFAAMQSMLQLCGFNATTVEDVFSAIGTIKRNADTTAAVSSSSAAVASLQCDCGAHLGGCKCADGPTSKRSIIDAGQPCDCRSTCEDVAQMDTETDPRHCRHQELLLAVTKNCGRIHVGAFYICSAVSAASVNVSACIRVCEPRASSCEDRSFQAPAAASTGPDYQTRRGRHEAQELGDDPAS